MSAELSGERTYPSIQTVRTNIDRSEIAAGVRNGLIQFVILCGLLWVAGLVVVWVYRDISAAQDRQFEREKENPAYRSRDTYSTP